MAFNRIYIILSLVHDTELLSYYDLELIFKVIFIYLTNHYFEMSTDKTYLWTRHFLLAYTEVFFVCVEVLWPSQPSGVMSSAVSLPNHTFTGQA